jgi:hypothetical protein
MISGAVVEVRTSDNSEQYLSVVCAGSKRDCVIPATVENFFTIAIL